MDRQSRLDIGILFHRVFNIDSIEKRSPLKADMCDRAEKPEGWPGRDPKPALFGQGGGQACPTRGDPTPALFGQIFPKCFKLGPPLAIPMAMYALSHMSRLRGGPFFLVAYTNRLLG